LIVKKNRTAIRPALSESTEKGLEKRPAHALCGEKNTTRSQESPKEKSKKQ